MKYSRPRTVFPAIVSSETLPACCGQTARRIFSTLMLALGASIVAPPIVADDSTAQANLQKWQLRRLYLPSEQELAKEQNGNVYVYDGLTDRQVEQALDTQFDRIEHMMFVGTVKTLPSGEPLRDENGNVVKESGGCL